MIEQEYILIMDYRLQTLRIIELTEAEEYQAVQFEDLSEYLETVESRYGFDLLTSDWMLSETPGRRLHTFIYREGKEISHGSLDHLIHSLPSVDQPLPAPQSQSPESQSPILIVMDFDAVHLHFIALAPDDLQTLTASPSLYHFVRALRPKYGWSVEAYRYLLIRHPSTQLHISLYKGGEEVCPHLIEEHVRHGVRHR